MAKAKRNSLEHIEQARKNLRSLPDKKAGKTRAETVELLAGDIRKAIEQGYTLKEIRDVLAQSGVSVSLARMQTLLGEGEKKGKPPVVDAVKDAVGSALGKCDSAPQTGGPSLSQYEEPNFVL